MTSLPDVSNEFDASGTSPIDQRASASDGTPGWAHGAPPFSSNSSPLYHSSPSTYSFTYEPSYVTTISVDPEKAGACSVVPSATIVEESSHKPVNRSMKLLTSMLVSVEVVMDRRPGMSSRLALTEPTRSARVRIVNASAPPRLRSPAAETALEPVNSAWFESRGGANASPNATGAGDSKNTAWPVAVSALRRRLSYSDAEFASGAHPPGNGASVTFAQ
mmetsp:Transcript_5242/g.21168  ORF Transcript_5242/g.21168 Transcript_5242/m.21168 type:complete len:219 (-) Transcript_5242:1419-2075(-)